MGCGASSPAGGVVSEKRMDGTDTPEVAVKKSVFLHESESSSSRKRHSTPSSIALIHSALTPGEDSF